MTTYDKKKTERSPLVVFRMPREERDALYEFAAERERSISAEIRLAIRRHVEAARAEA